MEQLTIVSATRKNTFDDTPLGKTFKGLPDAITNQVHFDQTFGLNNTRGLPEVYNEAIRNCNTPYCLFVHDDVWIEDAFFVDKLLRAHKYYDVVGLAGGDDQEPIPQAWQWTAMSKQRSGIVMHPTEQDKAITAGNYGPTPRPVALLDGLWLSIDLDKIQKTKTTFDETFDYHFYDLSFCYRARSAGLRLGTWPIWVRHEGLGDSANSQSWQDNKDKFVNTYRPRQDAIPVHNIFDK